MKNGWDKGPVPMSPIAIMKIQMIDLEKYVIMSMQAIGTVSPFL